MHKIRWPMNFKIYWIILSFAKLSTIQFTYTKQRPQAWTRYNSFSFFFQLNITQFQFIWFPQRCTANTHNIYHTCRSSLVAYLTKKERQGKIRARMQMHTLHIRSGTDRYHVTSADEFEGRTFGYYRNSIY